TVSTSNRKAFKTPENPQLVSIAADTCTCTLALTLGPTTLRPMRRMMLRAVLAVGFILSAPAFAQGAADAPASAEAFVAQAEKDLAAFSVLASRADWINRTYITDDTDALAAEFGARGTQLSV